MMSDPAAAWPLLRVAGGVAGHEFGRVGESKASALFLQRPERVKENGFRGAELVLGMRCECRGAKTAVRKLSGAVSCLRLPGADLFSGSQGFGSGCCEGVGLSLTSQLAEGGDKSAGEGLQLIVCQGDVVDSLGDTPHGFVEADGEGHQFAVGQICPQRDPGTS